MNASKKNSINFVMSRYGYDTAQVYEDLIKDYPDIIPMQTVLINFSEARRKVQERNPAPSPTVVPFTSRLADTTINDPECLSYLN